MKNNTTRYNRTLVFETAATRDTMKALSHQNIVDVNRRYMNSDRQFTRIEYAATNAEHRSIVEELKQLVEFTIMECFKGNREIFIRL
jgi:hypothetical protein